MNWQRLLIGNIVFGRFFMPAAYSQTAVRLTQPGTAVVFGACCLLVIVLATVLIPDMNDTSSQSLASQRTQPPANARILAATEAAGFVQIAYADYLNGVGAEAAATRQLAPPFSLPVALRRVEYIRPKLTVKLYQEVRSTYQKANKAGAISRDEILCGLPDIAEVTATSGKSDSRAATVKINKISGGKPAGTLTVTVDLKQRGISSIDCNAK